MLKKIINSLMAVALMVGVTASTIQPAEAGRGGRVAAGVAAGIIGLGILGAYANARDREYYRESAAAAIRAPRSADGAIAVASKTAVATRSAAAAGGPAGVPPTAINRIRVSDVET